MEPKILLVDDIVNTTYGHTSNWASISYNLQTIDDDTTREFSEMMGSENQSTSAGLAGRYIWFITGSLDAKDMVMTFLDCENNIDVAINFCKQAFQGDKLFTEMFMGRFTDLKASYQKNKFLYQLKVGSPKP